LICPIALLAAWCGEETNGIAPVKESLMRAIFASCAVIVLSLGVVMAEEFACQITKIETKDGKTMISGVKGKKKGEAGKEFGPFAVAKDVKVAKGKYDKDTKSFTAGDPIEDGLKAEEFKEISTEKPLNVTLTTDTKDVITQILVTKKKGK
jgi:hypothetical protein